ncbi:hypothetical protein [Nocardia brasiliensis]|uniref:hypothetical protein n=1 Tax=Nocardia brasiliensis TaxID=37326 RepID=UPI002458AEF0|nr:hypothetical protein [Nocardia brasiliensis]
MRSRLLDLVDRLITKLAQRIADRMAEQRQASAPTMTYHVHTGDLASAARMVERIAAARPHMHDHYR